MLAGSEGFMLEEIVTTTKIYKFWTTDLNFTLCLNKELDDEGNEKGGCFVVESLRDEVVLQKARLYMQLPTFFQDQMIRKSIRICFIWIKI